jgi:hypothetical protein
MSVSIRPRSLALATLGLFVLGATVAIGADPAEPAASSSASADPSLAPGVERVKVGRGGVLIGQIGQGTDVAMDDAERAAAASALDGISIGISAITLPGSPIDVSELPEALAARAAIEGAGATARVCDEVFWTKKKVICNGKDIEGLVAFPLMPGQLKLPARLLKRGFALAVAGDGGSAPTKGTVQLRQDWTALGMSQGRAAGAWAASAWPDSEVTVSIWPLGRDPDDPFGEAVTTGLLESLPNATVLPTADAPAAVDANLYTGAVSIPMFSVRLAAGDLGIAGEPLGIFSLACPEPLPSDEWFAGCMRVDYEPIGTAAAEAVVTVLMGGDVPAEIVVQPAFEVVPAP